MTAWTDDDVVMGLRHRDAADRGCAVPPGVDPDARTDRRCSRTSWRAAALLADGDLDGVAAPDGRARLRVLVDHASAVGVVDRRPRARRAPRGRALRSSSSASACVEPDHVRHRELLRTLRDEDVDDRARRRLVVRLRVLIEDGPGRRVGSARRSGARRNPAFARISTASETSSRPTHVRNERASLRPATRRGRLCRRCGAHVRRRGSVAGRCPSPPC